MLRHLHQIAILVTVLLAGSLRASAAPPDGFTAEPWPGDWREIVGIVPVGDGRFVAWERGGLAWMVGPDGMASVEPLVDLSDEVGAWRDHGLLGLALDPSFLENGHVYLLYVVDRHHLLFADTPRYDPDADDYFSATIGRITRYTATAKSDRAVVDPESRLILLGETRSTGLPILHQSHAVGALAFGRDGTLLCSMGDSGSYGEVDTGGQMDGGWVDMALKDGIIDATEDLGAFRAQSVDSLCGKILRIDPTTGDGVPSNPFHEADDPRSARSRVWALGLRNGFRISVAPGTGSTDPAAGDPGDVIYGDVGWFIREETGIVDGPGRNLGWPLFEGLDIQDAYWNTDIENPTAVNPLADGDCPTRYRFRDLLVEDGEIPSNPCDAAWVEAFDWSGPSFDTNWVGYMGDGYLDFGFTTGEWMDFELDVAESGPMRYGIRYANGSGNDRPVEVLLDGAVIAELDMPPTGGWTRWTRAWVAFATTPGTHVLRIRTVGPTGPNVDHVDATDWDYTPIDETPSFSHHRPTIDWRHNGAEARVPVFDNASCADTVTLSPTSTPVSGSPFGGNSATGGAMIDDPRWPAAWRGMFFADYIWGWIRVIRFDDDGDPARVETFDSTAGPITWITHDPASGAAVVVRWDQNPVKITPPPPACPADLDGDGVVGGGDIGLLLVGWGLPGPTDLDGDGTTDGGDLGQILVSIGPCDP